MALFRPAKPKPERQPVISEPEPARVTLPPAPAGDEQGRRGVEQQRDYLLSLVQPLPAFGMFLLDAWGCVLCEDITAPASLPEHDRATIDGYAVRAALAIPGARVQGVPVQVGDVLPERADAVIAVSEPTPGDIIQIKQPITPGEGVQAAGSGVRAGETLISSGQRLDARRAGMLAAAGIDRVLARPRPRVVVLSISDPNAATRAEISAAELDSHLISAAAKAEGCQVWRVTAPLGSASELRDLLSDQLVRADLLVVLTRIAGDQLLQVAGQMGAVDDAQLAQRPGSRLGFGIVGEDEIPVFFLPSDALGAYVCYQQFVRPAMRKLMGLQEVNPELQQFRAATAIPSHPGTTELICANISQSAEAGVTPIGNPGSQGMRELAQADALIVIDPWVGDVETGDVVNALLLSDD